MSLFTSFVALEERLNPVLVKEVRQSLRGKQFRGAFGFTIVIALLVAVSIVLNQVGSSSIDPIGPDFFNGAFSCLCVAVLAFVPLSAFNSMGAEFEEQTFDLLVLSRMRPRHIMLGKLLAALVQALLYFSVFGFFLVFAFLFGGIDLTLVLVVMPFLLMASVAFSSLALGLSSLVRKRVARLGLMIVLVASLIWAIIGSIAMTVSLVEFGVDFASEEVQVGMSAIFVGALVVGTIPFMVGMTRLAHPEENRSTGLRVLGFVLVLVILGWESWLYSLIGELEFIFFISIIGLLVAALFAAFFGTERECLGRRVEFALPENKVLRLLALPWLPGGGRGVLWFLATSALIIGYASSYLAHASLSVVTGNGLDILYLVAAYLCIYLFALAGILPNWARKPRRTISVRVAIPVLFVLGIIVPMIIGFMSEVEPYATGEHLGNPFWVVAQGFRADLEVWPVFAMAGFVLLLQVWRIGRGVREVFVAGTRHDQAQ